MRRFLPAALLWLAALFATAPGLRAAELLLTLPGGAQRLTPEALLARPDAARITVPADVAYHRAMSYRAVPLRALLGPLDGVETLEAKATDGFASQLPAALLQAGAEPWLAVEEPGAPWPALPGKSANAGPFYLVWLRPEQAGISPEQWPYALASLTAVAPPLRRWPSLGVDAGLAPDDPARRGQEVFVTQCLACHRLAGAGAAEMGPDLARPMPALAYMTEPGLRALIRDPKSVRDWPGQQMPGFSPAVLPEAELDALIAYLRHQAARR
ncbi:c-type cytochrome [Pseudoroseomonas cervicalis]|uniref:Cytochrome C n=1 Tax=Pseudoroseomonas cervicalis ATCC 49957 TaxID=525371 RepID=D5RL98_9PROT|nr:cytochrome c [Pseudoroseomonas cervicalis]EFH11917.1 cytochrome C [Pseudoroseomonas cervicalis ATCC 49957]